MTIQEEEYFPRGGVGGEIKKKRNFVFEKKNLFDAKGKKPGRRERKKKAKLSGHQDELGSDVAFERFEPLVYKGLSEGTLAFCSVRGIQDKYADISMPGRLSARLYIENVSQPYYTILKQQSSEQNEEGEKAAPMSSMFRIGQHINCSVLSVKNDKHYTVRVSSDPAHVNSHLTFDMVRTGTIMQMAVQSVEDHGFMMFSGVSGLVSFLPKANAFSYVNDQCNFKPLVVGQIVWCLVTKTKLSGTSNTVQVTLDFDSINKSKLDGDISIELLNPGVIVDVTVIKVVSQNLLVNIKGTDIHGYIEESQLSSMWSKPEDYKIGSLFTASVLYKFPYARIVALTLKSNPTTISKEEIKHGTIFERAEIKSIVKRGVCLKLESNSKVYKGMISVRRIGENVDYVTLSTKFPLGNHIKCRVIGYDALEQVYSCSTEDKLLNEKFLSRSDLQVGQLVDVTVESFKKSGVEVSVGAVKGYVPLNHICDVVIQNPLEKIAVKSKHKAKVLRFEGDNIIFTLRPTLVKTQSLTNFHSVEVGDSYYGWVNKILPSGIMVSFFGGLFARINLENLLDHPHRYQVGGLVKCYVVEIRPDRIPAFSLLKSVQNMSLTVGSTYNLLVKGISKNGLTCFFISRGQHFNAFIPLAHMCDYLEFCEEEMKKYEHGSVINGAILFSVNEKLPLFTLKKSVSDFFQKYPDMKNGFNSLKKKMLLPCSVSEVLSDRILVCAPIPGFNGKVPMLRENLTKNISKYSPYEALVTSVSKVLISPVEVSLTCHLESKQKLKWSIQNLENFLTYIQSFQKYTIGSKVDCKVKKVSSNSLEVVLLSANIKGVIRSSSKHNYKVGDTLTAVVLYHSVKENLLYLLFADTEISLWQPLKASLLNTVVSGTVLHVNPYFITAVTTDPEAFGNIVFLPMINDPNNLKKAISVKDVPLFSSCDINLKSVKEIPGERSIYFWIGYTCDYEKNVESQEQSTGESESQSKGSIKKPAQTCSSSDNIDALEKGSEVPKKKKKNKNTFNVIELEDMQKENSSFDENVSKSVDAKGEKNKKKKQNLRASIETENINDIDSYTEVESVTDKKKKGKRKSEGQADNENTLLEDTISDEVGFAVVDDRIDKKKKKKQKLLSSFDIENNSDLKNCLMIDLIGEKKKKAKLESEYYETEDLLSCHSNSVIKTKENSFIVSDVSMDEDCNEALQENLNLATPSDKKISLENKNKKKKKKDSGDFENVGDIHMETGNNLVNTNATEEADRKMKSGDKSRNKKSDANKKKSIDSILPVESKTPETSKLKNRLKDTDKSKNRKKKHIDEQSVVPHKKGKIEDEPTGVSLEDVAGFEWDATLSDLAKVTSGTIEEDELSQDSEEEKTPARKLTPAEKRAAAYEAERQIREKEEELLIAESNPQSAEHFDRLLTANPNSSKLWIMYMAHHMQATEIEKARSVAKRALKHINVRLEDERLNIWIASLNLENIYGTPDSFKEVLTDALKYNDDYKVYKRVLDIYADSNKTSELENLVHQLVKKHKNKMNCWVECQSALMKAGLHDKARNYLQRSLEALPTKEYCTLVSRFALIENKYGFPDQAHSLFENLLTSYPKRVDLWFVYIDMLTKSGTPELARNVLERATAQKLPVRKMKALYQKWVKFEETFGTPEKVEEVKEAAANYVKNLTSSLMDVS